MPDLRAAEQTPERGHQKSRRRRETPGDATPGHADWTPAAESAATECSEVATSEKRTPISVGRGERRRCSSKKSGTVRWSPALATPKCAGGGTNGSDVENQTAASAAPKRRLSRSSTTVWKEQQISDTFRRLQDDGEVHRDELPRALEMMGFPEPDDTWVEEVLENLTSFSTLSMEEFSTFVQKYEARQNSSAAELFAKFDKGGTGSINAGQLSELMAYCGVTPIRRVMDEIIMEVMGCQGKAITLNEFWRVMAKIRQSKGFTQGELKSFDVAFAKFSGKTKCLAVRDFPKMLEYLGHALSTEEALNIAHEVTNAEVLQDMEFMVCMRKVRDREIACVKRALRHRDRDGSGRLCKQTLMVVLMELDYLPEEAEVQEAMDEANIAGIVGNAEACFDGAWRVLEVYRDRDGFTKAYSAEIEDVFQRLADESASTLDATKVGRALRLLGHRLSHNAVQRLVGKVDAEGSGELNIREFSKVVRIHCRNASRRGWEALARHAERRQGMSNSPGHKSSSSNSPARRSILCSSPARNSPGIRSSICNSPGTRSSICNSPTFRSGLSSSPSRRCGRNGQRGSVAMVLFPSSACGNVGASSDLCLLVGAAAEAITIPEDDVLLGALRQSVSGAAKADAEQSLAPLKERLHAATDKKLSLQDFVQCVCRLRRSMHSFMKKHVNFTQAEVENQSKEFAVYSKDSQGEISNRRLQILLENLFPDLATSAERRPQLLQVVRTAMEGRTGTFNFNDFLRLARNCEDLGEDGLCLRETAAVKAARFGFQEVAELRELFVGGEDERTSISLLEVRELLAPVVPMGHHNAAALSEAFAEVLAERSEAKQQRRDEADFPEFLSLIRRLLDANVANINDFAERAAVVDREASQTPLDTPKRRRDLVCDEVSPMLA
eukprot:TRINITY_DN29495_c0_g1_i1.p1 TRINITY_DN29495_c0_g1~~TRINITY_DN29495_c0_g1_i1.p1  ORF type:complete len:972 (-),score=228.38 TRINITY_DN29495_c0_g1_i1:82-2769(-)